MRLKITSITVCLFSFVSILLMLFGHSDRVLAIPNSAIYKQAQQAQRSQSNFLNTLEKLVNIDSGSGNRDGLKLVENIIVEQLKAVGADIKFENLVKQPESAVVFYVTGEPRDIKTPLVDTLIRYFSTAV
jgi:hypothetical protein